MLTTCLWFSSQSKRLFLGNRRHCPLTTRHRAPARVGLLTWFSWRKRWACPVIPQLLWSLCRIIMLQAGFRELKTRLVPGEQGRLVLHLSEMNGSRVPAKASRHLIPVTMQCEWGPTLANSVTDCAPCIPSKALSPRYSQCGNSFGLVISRVSSP